MLRTSILLPKPLKDAAERVARARGKSLGALIRSQLEVAISQEKGAARPEPIFDDFRVYTGAAPEDLAERHDAYLYGDIHRSGADE